MILEQFENLSFCRHIAEDGQSPLSGISRRLSIATGSYDLMASTESSHVRSLLLFTSEELSEYFVRRITTTYKLLKVLDFEHAQFFNVSENLGSLIHLKYLSLRHSKIEQRELPKSVGMLQNLETLDLRETGFYEIPKEISKLGQLRHLLGRKMSLIQLKGDIGGMTSLQTLCFVNLDGDVELIRELGKLKQMRKLGLLRVEGEYGSILSSSINEMQYLEKLHIAKKISRDEEVLDLHFISSPPMLRDLRLLAKLEKLPKWIPKLQNLVKLTLAFSHITNDLMKSLGNMQNLLSLSISQDAYKGECLHFQDGGFQKLKELCLQDLNNLNSIIIDKGALYSLKKLELFDIPRLKIVPTDIHHLRKLEVLNIWDMPDEFVESIAPDGGKEHWIIEHVPHVEIDICF